MLYIQLIGTTAHTYTMILSGFMYEQGEGQQCCMFHTNHKGTHKEPLSWTILNSVSTSNEGTVLGGEQTCGTEREEREREREKKER